MDLRPFTVPRKLLLGAGPSNCSPRVLQALSQQTLGPVDRDMNILIDETRELLKKVFHTENKLTLVQQTSGSGGLETVIANVLEPKQRILVAMSGVWSERFAQIAELYQIDVVRLKAAEPAQVFSLERLEDEIKKHKPVMLFVTHGESSSGLLQPLEGLGDICHKYDCLLAVDAVITLATEPFYVDKWKLDVVVGATQKGVGAPPGFALLTFSPLAEKIIMNRTSFVPFYFDVKGLAFNWHCYETKRGYYYTYSSNMIAALREALAEKLEEGLENVWQRHKTVNEYFVKQMEKIGLRHYVDEAAHRVHSVNMLLLPEDITWQQFIQYAYNKHDASISFGIGPTTNKAIRLGLMGVNATMPMADHVTKIVIEALEYCRQNKGEQTEMLGMYK